MSDQRPAEAPFELESERYELRAPAATLRFDANRREFFKLLGGGLLDHFRHAKSCGAGVRNFKEAERTRIAKRHRRVAAHRQTGRPRSSPARRRWPGRFERRSARRWRKNYMCRCTPFRW